jgi:hypothetical protein
MLRYDVRRPGPARNQLPHYVGVDALSDDHVWAGLRVAQSLPQTDEVGAVPHPHAASRNAELNELVEKFPLRDERQQKNVETTLAQGGNQQRPLPLSTASRG